jgi:hypothetical protein
MAGPALGLQLDPTAESVVARRSDHWSFLRVMPAVALSRGYRLYYPEGEGPLMGWSYGPAMPCLQLPLGALPNPVAVVVAAGVLNELVLLIPLFLLARRLLPPTPSRTAAGVLLVGGLQGLMLFCPASAYWLRGIQVDTFAMGLTALGFWVLLGADSSQPVSLRRICAAAALLAGGVFSKQNEFFTLAAPIAWLAARDGSRAAIRFTGLLAAAGLAGFLLCLAAVGWDALFLNTCVVPAGHPWNPPGLGYAGTVAVDFLLQIAGFLALFGLLLALVRRELSTPSTPREWVLSRPWVLPAVAAALIFPVSVLGKVKVGGGDNSNHPVYYLIAAAAMTAGALMRSERPLFRLGVPAAVLATILVAASLVPEDPQPLAARAAENRLGEEYRFALRHPGEVWLSANPLVTLYTDGKLYHQGYGVFDRTLAHQPPTPRHLQKFLPEKLRWACTPGAPFWMPEGLTPTSAPEGVRGPGWYERRPVGR